MTITCIWNGHNTLGESPLWDPHRQLLYWIDIEQARLFAFNPDLIEYESWSLPDKPGCIALHKNGGLIATLRKSFVTIELPNGIVSSLNQALAQRQDVRFNDGKCDRQGRFWAGTAEIEEKLPLGGLYRLDKQGVAELVDEGFTVSNGIGWNLKNTIMYFTDSPARIIYQYDFDAESGKISNRRPFIRFAEDEGYPDGLTVDSEGYLWVAHWDGWRVSRFSPEGKVDKVIEMPVQRPTSCCFGGKDMDILFVTSASRDLSPEELAKGPQAGALFAIPMEVKGLPEPEYGS